MKGHEPIYLSVSFYDDGRIGEIWIDGHLADEVRGFLDALAITLSVALQHGCELRAFTSKFRGIQIGPAGLTGDPEYPIVSSYVDYIGRYLDDLDARRTKAQSG